MTKLRIGARSSPLSLQQVEEVVAHLLTKVPGITRDVIEFVPFLTKGDKNREARFSALGAQGVFTKEIDEAVIRGDIDIAVHSAKDMASQLPPELTIGAILPRQSPWDVWVCPTEHTLWTMPKGSRIGTAALRRQAYIYHHRPDLKVELLRGNVMTRLGKLTDGLYDAIILAQAGLDRFHVWEPTWQPFSEDTMLPAVGQGALAVTIRADREDLKNLLAPICHKETVICVTAERAFLRTLGGSCRTAAAAYATIKEGEITLRASLLKPDGSQRHEVKLLGRHPEELGCQAAAEICKLLTEPLSAFLEP